MAGIGSFGGLGDIVLYLGVADAGFSSKLAGAKAQADQLADNIQNVMNKAIIAGGAAFATAAISAMKFESAFAGVTKTVDGLRDPMGNLNKDGEALAQQFRDLALEIPVSVNELARIGELGGQLGIPKASLIEFTDTIAKLGVTTNLSVEEGSTALARFVNVTKQVAPAGMGAGEQIARIGSTIVELGNNFATTEAEIVTFAQRLAGAGNQIGLSQAEILSIATALSSVGVNAEAGGTAFTKVFIEMSKSVDLGGKNLGEFAKVAGVDIPAFSKMFKEDAAGAISLFVSGLLEMKQNGESVFGVLEEMGLNEIRVQNSLLLASSAADQFNKALTVGKKAYEENNALTKEAAQRFGTLESQLGLFKNVVQDAFISIGNGLLPALSGIIKLLNEHPYAVQAAVKSFAEFAMVIGSVSAAYKIYQIAAKAVQALNLLMATSFGPIGIALTALVGLVTVYTNLLQAKKDAQLKAIAATSDEVAKVESLEKAYDQLAKSEDPKAKEEMRAIVEKLALAYGMTKDEVKKLITEENTLTGIYKQKRLDELKKEFESLTLVERTYGQQSLETSDQLARAGMAAENAGFNFNTFAMSLSDNEKKLLNVDGATQELNPKLTALKDEINQLESEMVASNTTTDEAAKKTDTLATSTEKLKSAQELLSEAGITTIESYQKQISELEKLLPYVKDNDIAMMQWRQQMFDLQDSIEGLKIKETLQTPADEAGKRLKDLGVVTGEARMSVDKYIPSLITLEDITKKQADETEKATKKFDFATKSVGEYGLELIDAAGQMGLFGDSNSKASRAAGLFAGTLETVLKGGFDPLSLGISVVTGLFGIFGGKAKEVNRTMEEVTAIVAKAGIDIEGLNKTIEGLEFDSPLLDQMKSQMDSIMESMRTAVGTTFKNLQWELKLLTDQMDILLQPFELRVEITGALDSVKKLIDEINATSKYLDTTDMTGYNKLLEAQLLNLSRLLKTVPEGSQAYLDLSEAIDEIVRSLNALNGVQGTSEDGAKVNIDRLKSQYDANELLRQSLQDRLEAEWDQLDAGSEGNAQTEELTKLLQELYNEQKRISDLMAAYNNALKDNNDVVNQVDLSYKNLTNDTLPNTRNRLGEVSDVISKIDLSWKNQKNSMTESGDEAGVVSAKYQEMNKNLDATNTILRALKINWGSALEGAMADFNTFEANAKTVAQAMEDMLYFKVDFDTTMADEQISATLQSMYLYMQSLDPASQAYRDAEESLKKLVDQFVAMGGVLPPYIANMKTSKEKTDEFMRSIKHVAGDVLPNTTKQLKNVSDATNVFTKSIQRNSSEFVDAKKQTALMNKELANMQTILRGLQSEKLKIKFEFEAKKADLEKQMADWQATFDSLTAEKKAINLEFDLKIGKTAGDIGLLQQALEDIDRGDLGVDSLYELSKLMEQLSGQAQVLTIDWEDMLDVMFADYDNMTKDLKTAGDALDKMEFFNIDFAGTNVDEQISLAIFRMNDFIGTLDKSSPAFKQAKADMDALIIRFLQLSGKELPAAVKQFIAYQKELEATKDKIDVLQKEKIQIDLDIADFKKQREVLYKTISDLEKQRIDIDIKLAEDTTKINKEIADATDFITASNKKKIEIDLKLKEDTEKIRSEIKSVTQSLNDLYEKREENNKQYRETNSQVRTLNGYLTEMASKDPAALANINLNEMWRLIAGINSEVTALGLEWDKTWATVFGDFDTFFKYDESTGWKLGDQISDVLDKMSFFKVDFDTTSMDEQLNALIFRMKDFIGTLDPDSQAFLESNKMLQGFIDKFKALGGVLDENAAKDFISNEGEDAMAILQKQLADLKLEDNKIDFDIKSAQEKIATLNQELKDLAQKALDEKTQIDFDIQLAQDKIAALSQELLDLAQKAIDDKAQIDIDIENALIELDQVINKLNELELRKPQIDLDISAAQARITELEQLLLDFDLTQFLDKEAAMALQTEQVNTEVERLQLLLQELIGDKGEYNLKVDADILAAQGKIMELYQQLAMLESDFNDMDLQLDVNIANAMTKILELQNALNALAGKVINVTGQGATIVINVSDIMHEGGLVGGYKAHTGGDIPAILKRGEYVIRDNTVAKFDRSQWDNLNLTGNPAALIKDTKNGQGAIAVNNRFDVIIRSADPHATAQFIRNEVTPGVNRINRKMVVKENPYDI